MFRTLLAKLLVYGSRVFLLDNDRSTVVFCYVADDGGFYFGGGGHGYYLLRIAQQILSHAQTCAPTDQALIIGQMLVKLERELLIEK